MRKMTPAFQAFLHAFGTFAYIALVVTLLANASWIFAGQDNFLIPMFMLMLLVISATVTGLLVLGRPIAMFIGGARKEAGMFLGMTLGWLFLFMVIVGTMMVTIR